MGFWLISTTLFRRLVITLMLSSGLFAVGCAGGGGSGRYDLSIVPDAALASEATPPTIAVDVFAVSAAEESQWTNTSLSAYWAPNSTIRATKSDTIKQFRFGPGAMSPQTLSKDDQIWSRWGSYSTLIILARLPGVDDQPGELDVRRVMYPTARDRWDGGLLRVALQRNRLVKESTPKVQK